MFWMLLLGFLMGRVTSPLPVTSSPPCSSVLGIPLVEDYLQAVYFTKVVLQQSRIYNNASKAKQQKLKYNYIFFFDSLVLTHLRMEFSLLRQTPKIMNNLTVKITTSYFSYVFVNQDQECTLQLRYIIRIQVMHKYCSFFFRSNVTNNRPSCNTLIPN